MRNKALSLLFAASLAALLLAQASAPTLQPGEFTYTTRPYSEFTFAAHTNLVPVMAVVRDGKGNPVDGLTQGDFVILDQDQPQTISHFAVERQEAAPTAALPAPTPAPETAAPAPVVPPPARTVAFFFDDFETPIAQLTKARIAIRSYLDHDSAKNVRFGIFTTSGAERLDFTSDVNAINAALDKVEPHPRATSRGCPVITPYQAYYIAEMHDPDATDLAIGQAMSPQCGQCPQQTTSARIKVFSPPPVVFVEDTTTGQHGMGSISERIQGHAALAVGAG